MEWRDLVKYWIFVAQRTSDLLDALHEVSPCPPIDPDRFYGKDLHLSNWVRTAGRDTGLITETEHQRFYADIGPHI